MITEILTPLDGTTAAEAAVPWVRGAAAKLQSTVSLLHVIDEDEVSPTQLKSAESYLDSQRQLFDADGVDTTIEIVAGRPADAIIERANRVNLSVMTSGTVRWLVSAVLDQVLNEVLTPLVIVRASNGKDCSTAATDAGIPNKIIVPLDDADYSLDVLPTVREIARGLDASIVLLHVVAPVGEHTDRNHAPPGVARILDQMVAESNALTQRAAFALASGTIKIETMTEIGLPDRSIIRAAEKTGAALIAMATRGRDRLEKRISGSVANAVMESTPIPCLFVRPVREHVPA